MFELATLTAGTKAITGLYSALKTVVDVKKNLDLMDKLEKILELKMTLLDAKEEILSLREKVSDLEARRQADKDMEFDPKRGFYWSKGGEEGRLAYCTKCWVDHGRLAPMLELKHVHHCHVCNTNYQNPDYSPPQAPQEPRSMNPYTNRW